jgi:acyl-CoA synthetase (AMP-forming)/AMP-acid ligase II
MIAKLLHATESFVGFDAQGLEQSIPRRFETQLVKRPATHSIQTRKHALSYEQLNGGANVIAREILNRQGKGSEPIHLLLENDAPMIEAILGVLKAGKIVVPLERSLPSSRLSYILQNTPTAADHSEN